MTWGLNNSGWGTTNQVAPASTVTASEILGNVQTSLLEPNDGGVTWPSLIYTNAQALGFLNDRHRKMVGDSALTTVIGYQGATAGTSRVNLPQNLSTIRRVAWANSDAQHGRPTLTSSLTFTLRMGCPPS